MIQQQVLNKAIRVWIVLTIILYVIGLWPLALMLTVCLLLMAILDLESFVSALNFTETKYYDWRGKRIVNPILIAKLEESKTKIKQEELLEKRDC